MRDLSTNINAELLYLESAGPIRDIDGRIIAPAQRWPIELPDNHPFKEPTHAHDPQSGLDPGLPPARGDR